METKTRVQSGALTSNHNETLIRRGAMGEIVEVNHSLTTAGLILRSRYGSSTD
jgi:hypothetical protein